MKDMHRRTPPLPGEICDMVVDQLAHDWRALAACARVPSHHPAARARFHLCRRMITLFSMGTASDEMTDFMATFAPGSPLAALPLSLHIQGAGFFSPDRKRWTSDTVAGSHLQNMRALKLSGLDARDVAECGLLRTLPPRLEELDIVGLRNGRAAGPGGGDDGPREPEKCAANASELHETALRPQCFPPLRALRIYLPLLREDASRLLDTLREDIGRAAAPLALHTLSLHLPAGCALAPWAGVVAQSHTTLRELRFSTWRPLSAEQDAPFYAALGTCTGLRSLTLTLPHDVRGQSARTGLAGLAGWLAPLPACAAVRTLRTLSIAVVLGLYSEVLAPDADGPAVGPAPEAWAAGGFGRAFAPAAYPALADLRVTVYYRCKNPSVRYPLADSTPGPLDDLLRMMSGALEPTRDAGVRVDLGRQSTGHRRLMREECV